MYKIRSCTTHLYSGNSGDPTSSHNYKTTQLNGDNVYEEIGEGIINIEKEEK